VPTYGDKREVDRFEGGTSSSFQMVGEKGGETPLPTKNKRTRKKKPSVPAFRGGLEEDLRRGRIEEE